MNDCYTCSLELGRGFSSTPDMSGGVGSSWGFVSNEDDADLGPRASWGIQSNPPSTQVDIAPSKIDFSTSFHFFALVCWQVFQACFSVVQSWLAFPSWKFIFLCDSHVPENALLEGSVCSSQVGIACEISISKYVGVRSFIFTQSLYICLQASLEVTNPKRGATRFRKSTGSIDLGSPRTSSIDGASSSPGRAFEPYRINHSQDLDSSSTFGSLATSKDSNRISAFFGGNDSPRASLNQSFSRFDSFGAGSSVAPPRPSG